MKFRIWAIEFHLNPLYLFHWVLKISSSLWKILLPIRQITEPGFSPHGNPGFNFFEKIIETSSYGILTLGEIRSQFFVWLSSSAIDDSFQSENQIENQNENWAPLWELPNIGYYSSCSIVFRQHYIAMMMMVVFIMEANGVTKKRFVWNYEQQVVSWRGNFGGVI
jgi:hypothetical protein